MYIAVDFAIATKTAILMKSGKKIFVKSIAAALFLALALSGCIELKEEYPDIKYYAFTQEPFSIQSFAVSPVTLMARDFIMNSEYETQHILARWADGRVQRYFYHRWAGDLSSLITDFISNRINISRAFAGGVVKPTMLVMPDYIIEGEIMEMIAKNSENAGPGDNYVKAVIKINLLTRAPQGHRERLIFAKIYEDQVNRRDNLVVSIAPAFSEALSRIAETMIVDIGEAVKKDMQSDS